jgi:hypothetical protein
MTSSTAVYLLMLAAFALMPVVIILQLTRFAHTCYRDRLWRLRDNLVDDLLRGRIERSRGALRLLRLVESNIRVAGRPSLTDVILGLLVLRPQDLPSVSDKILDGSLQPRDREKLAAYFNQLIKANTRHIYAGSLLGWVVFACRPLARVLGRVGKKPRSGVRGNLAQQAERVELRMPELVPSRRAMENGDRGPILPLLQR